MSARIAETAVSFIGTTHTSRQEQIIWKEQDGILRWLKNVDMQKLALFKILFKITITRIIRRATTYYFQRECFAIWCQHGGEWSTSEWFCEVPDPTDALLLNKFCSREPMVFLWGTPLSNLVNTDLALFALTFINHSVRKI